MSPGQRGFTPLVIPALELRVEEMDYLESCLELMGMEARKGTECSLALNLEASSSRGDRLSTKHAIVQTLLQRLYEGEYS